MVSLVRGQIVAFALDSLQQRGTMFVKPGEVVEYQAPGGTLRVEIVKIGS